MGLLEQIKNDIATITGDSDDFGTAITFTTPDGNTSKTVTGLATRHHMAFDTNGNTVSSRQVHVAVAEQNFEDYTVRNDNNEVSLKGHKVSWTDSTGVSKNYLVSSWMPDDTVGLITIFLKDLV